MYCNPVNIFIVKSLLMMTHAGHLIHEMYVEKYASVWTLKCAKEFGE
jgi:hypothetical protein